ncbi:glycosyltransferase family 39 protein [Patescibacteria group bacterium]|nr:glycosyltransferase family 39 protein [Patescibacteria group bacterium]MCL5410144.1 glycosyltransferase family 39 protein [Patescibacteria group bacterium]
MGSTSIDYKFILALVIFIILNLLLYSFILVSHKWLPINLFNYRYNSQHYIQDNRIKSEGFDLINSLAVWDAQWYLKIAVDGYPQNPTLQNYQDPNVMGGMSYGFFPLWPLLLRLANLFFPNIETAAFITTNLLIVINFISLYWVVGKLFSPSLALKTVFLLFVFPLSIFFRSYYVENLQLLTLIWFGYFMIKQKLLISATLLAFMNITKGNGWLLNIWYLVVLFQRLRANKLKFFSGLLLCGIVILPLVLWLIFCFIKTQNPFYFLTVRHIWLNSMLSPIPLLDNLLKLALFPSLPFHSFHASQIDSLMMIVVTILLIKSKNFLPSSLWWISLAIFVTPLLVNNMSFSRLQTVSFPLYIYLANLLKKGPYLILAGIFLIGIFLTSIFFINWYWVG